MAISAEKRRKMKVYAQFYEFNERLLINMKYGREKISKVADGFDYVQKAMNGGRVLNGEDGEILHKYISEIGETDAVSQLEYLNDKKAVLLSYKNKSEENYKKYGSLYFKLSLMAGLLIAVLLA